MIKVIVEYSRDKDPKEAGAVLSAIMPALKNLIKDKKVKTVVRRLSR